GANNASDFLSRHPLSRDVDHTQEDAAENDVNFLPTHAIPKAMTLQEIKDETKKDKTLQGLAKIIREQLWNSKPKWHELNTDNDDIKLLCKIKMKLPNPVHQIQDTVKDQQVRENDVKAKERMKANADRVKNAKESKMFIGDTVLIQPQPGTEEWQDSDNMGGDLSDGVTDEINQDAVVYGFVIVGGAFVVKYFGTLVLQLAYSIFGILGGPLLGIFFLGVLVPRANYKGAYAGAFVGFVLTITIAIGGMIYPPDKMAGSISIKECKFYNSTTYANTTVDGIIAKTFVPHSEPLAKLGSLSYLWYSATAVATTFVVGVIVSLIC
ncbi:sodium-coupled monocarboxylate transporter 1-like, partial [Paramuricea clavata]